MGSRGGGADVGKVGRGETCVFGRRQVRGMVSGGQVVPCRVLDATCVSKCELLPYLSNI